MNFNGDVKYPRQEIWILGALFDKRLTFKSHTENPVRRTSQELTFFSRISWLLDGQGKELLYKAQLRLTQEYSCRSWGGENATHLNVLVNIQQRAKRVIAERPPGHPTDINSLQHTRYVAGLATVYRIHYQELPLLHPMRLPGRRAVDRAAATLEEPRCCTTTPSDTVSSGAESCGKNSSVSLIGYLILWKGSNAKHMHG